MSLESQETFVQVAVTSSVTVTGGDIVKKMLQLEIFGDGHRRFDVIE